MAVLDGAGPIGAAATVEVDELVPYVELGQRSSQRPTELLELSITEIAGHRLVCGAVGWRRVASVDGEVVVALDLDRRPGEVGGDRWSKPVELFGEHAAVSLESDRARGSRLRGPLRFLRVTGPSAGWCWHFVGGRAAGERLVLVRGDEPGGQPVVTTFPASHGRALGSPAGGATADRHVTSWTADALVAEVVLAELLAASRLDGLVDYRAARVVEGAQELTGYAPRVEGNTE